MDRRCFWLPFPLFIVALVVHYWLIHNPLLANLQSTFLFPRIILIKTSNNNLVRQYFNKTSYNIRIVLMEPNFGYITISNQLFFAFRVIFKKKSNLSPFYFIVMKFIWFINWTFTQMMWLGGWGGNHLTLSQNSQLFRIWWASDQSINGLFRLDTKFAMLWRSL